MNTKPQITVMDIFPPLEVNYNDSPDEMVCAGRYDWIDRHVNFPPFEIIGKGKVRFKPLILGFNMPLRSTQVISFMENEEILPGKIEYLLSFGSAFPEEQRKNPIVALGSLARIANYPGVASISRSGSERTLCFSWFKAISWFQRYRFLGVRIIQ